MRAAIFREKHQIEVADWKSKELLPNEVKILVKNCGICGTDQHIYHGYPGSAAVTPPIVLGHELAGEVVQLGSEVNNIQIGDRVSVDPNIYCGNCAYCRNGSVHLCNHLQAIGVTRDGGMAEFCIVSAANCYPLPEGMSYEEGALVEPLGCVLHGFKKIDIRATHTVLIIGGGFIGQLFLQLVMQQGAARIIVREPAVEKHSLLLKLGAHEVYQPDLNTSQSAMMADVVIECVGRKESMETAIESAAKGGQVLLFGVSSPSTQISVSPFAIFSKELKIMGSFINPYTHEEAIAMISQKLIDVETLISHHFQLNEVPVIMENYPKMNVGKGMIGFS